MQKTSRTPPVIAIDNMESKVVRLQPRSGAIQTEDKSRPEEDVEALAALMERASNATRQMRYFGLASKRFSFLELISSAGRAGFVQVDANPRLNEASFAWASGPADFIFSVSFRDPAKVSVVAESQADVFGLVLTAYSDVASISVEVDPTIGDSELGRNAVTLKNMLLAFPEFDDQPAWTKYPEGHIPQIAGVLEMWRDGASLSSVFGQAWTSIYPRLLIMWESLRNRWHFPR